MSNINPTTPNEQAQRLSPKRSTDRPTEALAEGPGPVSFPPEATPPLVAARALLREIETAATQVAEVPPPGESSAATVARRSPLMLILPALLLLGVGVALGVLRKPAFTATDHASLQIISSEPAALGGIAQNTPTEAASLSRAVISDRVLGPSARVLGLSTQEAAASVSATPVPQSGAITFTATASSSARAARLVNLIAAGMSTYVSREANASSQAPAVLAHYEAALTARRDLAAVGGTRSVAAIQAATLKVSSLKLEYQNDLLAPTTRLVIFDTATSASSDRKSMIELLGIIGLGAGLVGGFALGALRAQRLNRRTSRSG